MESEDCSKKMPPRLFIGNNIESTLYFLWAEWSKPIPDATFPGMEVRPRILGFRLPKWQRALVWTDDQNRRFLESAWLALHLGTFVVTSWVPKEGTDTSLLGLIIDGQQRFSAIQKYFEDGFPVFGYKWSEIGKSEKREFLSRKFTGCQIDLFDEKELMDLYDRLNFGGTPHEESQRAVKCLD